MEIKTFYSIKIQKNIDYISEIMSGTYTKNHSIYVNSIKKNKVCNLLACRIIKCYYF